MIIHLFDDNLIPTIAKKSDRFDCKFGTFYHSIIIGKKWGSKIYNDKKTGFIHILKSNPCLWFGN
jgi:tRNA A58 N-methylase Trm61